jgi:hypothetical protein
MKDGVKGTWSGIKGVLGFMTSFMCAGRTDRGLMPQLCLIRDHLQTACFPPVITQQYQAFGFIPTAPALPSIYFYIRNTNCDHHFLQLCASSAIFTCEIQAQPRSCFIITLLWMKVRWLHLTRSYIFPKFYRHDAWQLVFWNLNLGLPKCRLVIQKIIGKHGVWRSSTNLPVKFLITPDTERLSC